MGDVWEDVWGHFGDVCGMFKGCLCVEDVFGGCLWECFCVLLAIGALTVGIGCLVTADQEKDNGEWLQISTGILIIILVFPLSLFLIVFLPHVFFTAIYVTETDISLPRSIFLLRTMVPLSSISKLSTETRAFMKEWIGKLDKLIEMEDQINQ